MPEEYVTLIMGKNWPAQILRRDNWFIPPGRLFEDVHFRLIGDCSNVDYLKISARPSCLGDGQFSTRSVYDVRLSTVYLHQDLPFCHFLPGDTAFTRRRTL